MFSGSGTGVGDGSRLIPGFGCGRWLAATAILVLAGTLSLNAQPRRSGTERTFFLVLDAVPFSTVAALHRAGSAPELFAELGEPVPLISSFPSTTTVALADALGSLGLELSPGYEARFFDWREERVRGGGAISYFRIEFPWRNFFQWNKKGVARSALASLRPVGASESRVVAGLDAFLASDLDRFFAYIETTDTAAHLKGPSSLDDTFGELGRAISRARNAGEQFRVVVFSDHGIDGGEPLRNVLPGIRRSLHSAGLRPAKTLEGADDVVLTPYGLVSSFEAYARESQAPRLGRLLAATDGVDLCSYRFEGDLWVASATGLATIDKRLTAGGEEWAYRRIDGDPLRYGEAVERMRGRKKFPPAGDWFSDRLWFEETRDEFYPDALRRISRGFELVKNPATVICSAEPGYMYGAKKTERAARITGGRLKWTHGALFWEASAGFLLTDVGEVRTGARRLSSALSPLVSGQRVAFKQVAAKPGIARGSRE